MTEQPPRQEQPVQPCNEENAPLIKIDRSNLDEALKILRRILDEEEAQQ